MDFTSNELIDYSASQLGISPDEKIIWTGKPDSLAVHVKEGFGYCIFGFLGMTVILAVIFLLKNAGELDRGMVMIVSPFLIGAVCLILSPIYFYWLAGRLDYVLTDQRLMIVQKRFRVRAKSWDLGELKLLESSEDENGIGNVIFDKQWREGANRRGHYHYIGFYGIRDARKVEKVIRETAAKLMEPN